MPKTQFDYSGTYNWEVLKGKIEFLTFKTDGSITSSFSLSTQDEQQVYGTWSALPDNRLKIERGEEYIFTVSDCGLLLSVLEPAALKNTQLQSTLLQNFQPQEELIELQLNEEGYHVECEYSISNGGGTGQEYPQNLLNPGE